MANTIGAARGGQRRHGREADHACLGCGYGVRAGRAPIRCPMCGGRSWRLVRSRPFPAPDAPAGIRTPVPLRPVVSLQLDDDEREALLTILYVVRDNWWLSDAEERVLSKLELLPGSADEPAAA